MSNDMMDASTGQAGDAGAQAQFLSLLADQLDKGKSVYQGLLGVEQAIPGVASQSTARGLAEALRAGSLLSAAMKEQRQLFAPTVVWMVATGEKLRVLEVALRLAAEWARTGGPGPIMQASTGNC